MTPQPSDPDLPQHIAQDLLALGNVQAPKELWQRVQDARQLEALARVQAPAELWDIVQAELNSVSKATSSSILAGIFGRPWLTAAAAVLVIGGLLVMQPWRDGDHTLVSKEVVLAERSPDSIRAAFRARVKFQRVSPVEMSPFAQGLGTSLGSLPLEDDA